MKDIKRYEFGVLGGGLGGLGAAALLTQESSSLALVESHYHLGGCASWYTRKGFTFDVGATTLSAIESHQPLGKFASKLQIPFDFQRIDPGIIYLLKGKQVHRHSGPQLWQESLKKINAHTSQEFWERIKRVHDFAWQTVDHLTPFPPKSKKDFLHQLMVLAKKIELKDLLYLSLPVSEWPGFSVTNQAERNIINETLLISCQGEISQVPGIFAAMGLEYPAHTYYHPGGMKGFVSKISDYLEQKEVSLFMRNPVLKIEKKDNGYFLQGKKEALWVENLVMGVPLDNGYELFCESEEKNYLHHTRKKFSATYGALTAYIGLEHRESLPGLYFQIHLKNKPEFVSSDSLFLSFSQQDDLLRAPSGMRTLSVSTHTQVKDWKNLSEKAYLERKKQFELFIRETLEKEMGDFNLGAIQEMQIGTPKSFIDFTRRAHGLVGGYPATYQNNPLKKPFNKTPFENLFLVGDTVFPAQGSPGVLLGALNAYEHIDSLN